VIRVFFNEDGYYVAGEGVEIARCCSPALTERGDRIFQPLQHTYKVLYLALCELRTLSISDDVMVYGDSRIIDEINGTTESLDATNNKWLNALRRSVIPSIKSVVFFRKKAAGDIQREISAVHSAMLPQVDQHTLEEIARKEEEQRIEQQQQRSKQQVAQLRDNWFGGNENDK